MEARAQPRWRSAGERAVLIDCADTAEALALAAAARESRAVAGLCEEIVPGARTVLFDRIHDHPALHAALGIALDAASRRPGPRTPDAATGPLVELPCVYDGPDLAVVAEQWETTVEELVAWHRSQEFVVAFCGFAPGFGYCVPVDAARGSSTGKRREVARRTSPRPSVPAGSIGLAGEFTGVYPQASPGGWQLIGRTSAVLWDATRAQPALLAPGVRVRFRDGRGDG